MPDFSPYLNRVLRSAGLDRAASERVRLEAHEHLMALYEARLARGEAPDEAARGACGEFGDPDWVGRSIRLSLGGWRSFTARWLRPVPVALALFLLGWTVNTYAFEVYSIQGTALSQRLPQGSHVVVEKWGAYRVHDIVVFREGDRSLVGVVEECPPQGRLQVHRDDRGTFPVERPQVVGRVVLRVP